MKLTTKGRFALRALLDVAIHGERNPVCLTEVAERQSLSVAYLEQLFVKMRRAGLVASVRGPGGGYRLARDASEISAADVVNAVEGRIDARQCGGSSASCGLDGAECMTHDLWASLNQTLEDVLSEATLSRIINNYRARQEAARSGVAYVRADPAAMRRGLARGGRDRPAAK